MLLHVVEETNYLYFRKSMYWYYMQENSEADDFAVSYSCLVSSRINVAIHNLLLVGSLATCIESAMDTFKL